MDFEKRRNEERPAGIYWGDVAAELFHAVNPHSAPPTSDQRFSIVVHTLH